MNLNKTHKEEIQFLVKNADVNLPEVLRMFAKEYHKKQLTLTDVSQQRELLNFLKWYDEDLEYNSKQTHEQLILSYVQKFNCG